jgi:hypothetical protein
MAHGLLHYCGYGDKEGEEQIMRLKEDEKIAMFHVKNSFIFFMGCCFTWNIFIYFIFLYQGTC